MSDSGRYWSFVESQPDPIPEFTPLVLTTIVHRLDLDTLEYDWTAHFINEDPWAESSSSQAVRNYQVQRDETGWQMRLVGRTRTSPNPIPGNPPPRSFIISGTPP